ncbi:MAG: type 4a pilus biogenesis protein PilO [Actinomycetota bacterium]|nr:type 4a pilus biogenesis protein PilO [Actinomycetota bacterium]
MNRRVIAIAVAASVVVAGIWYMVLWSPQSKSLNKANARVAAAQATQASLRSDIKLLQREQTELPAKQAVLEKLKQLLPNVPSLDSVIDNVNNAALASGVDWQSLAPTKPAAYATNAPPAVAGLQAIQVTMAVNGAYPQLLDFVNRLNAMPRLLDVNSVNLAGVGPAAAKTTATIVTQIFYLPAPGAATAAPAAPAPVSAH